MLKLITADGKYLRIQAGQVWRLDEFPNDTLKVAGFDEYVIHLERKNKPDVTLDLREFAKSARIVEHLSPTVGSGQTPPARLPPSPAPDSPPPAPGLIPGRKHGHYFRWIGHLQWLDIYRIFHLFTVTDSAIQHAIKKLMAPGGRGAGKDFRKDVQEAIDTLQRRLEMLDEDEAANGTGAP